MTAARLMRQLTSHASLSEHGFQRQRERQGGAQAGRQAGREQHCDSSSSRRAVVQREDPAALLQPLSKGRVEERTGFLSRAQGVVAAVLLPQPPPPMLLLLLLQSHQKERKAEKKEIQVDDDDELTV